MTKRKFLKIAGSTSLILAATSIGFGAFVTTRNPKAALLPWKTAGTEYSDPMRHALSYAILAPNPHNRQPWVIDLRNDTEAVLRCDLQRLLPATDPFSRQIVIGLGCFLELFALAASHNGYRAQITLFPDGEPGDHLNSRAIAHLALAQDSQIKPDPLFLQTIHRRTNRESYDMSRSISENVLLDITSAASSDVIAGGVEQGALLEKLRKLTREAMRNELLDPVAFQESIDLMRIGRKEIEANPDGLSLRGAFVETLSLVGAIDRKALADPSSSAFRTGLEMADEQALTAMGFVWINTGGNTRQHQIAAGRSYMRLALRASGLGLAMQPMSQALQEYATMKPHFKQIHDMLSHSSQERIQMLARIGYANNIVPAPRWPLSSKIKHS